MSEITSLTALGQYAQGQIVELPGFGDDQPFVVRLRRPSLMVLMKSGKIPNALLSTANSLFTGSGKALNDPSAIPDIVGVLDVICEASFVEPTWAQLQGIGLELTDQQYMAVFNYSQQGIKALDPFRQQPEHKELPGSGAAV
jgi:hypothetical protein